MAERSRLTDRLAGLLATPEAPEVLPDRTVQLNIELPESLRHALHVRALSQRTTASAVVRELIQDWLDS